MLSVTVALVTKHAMCERRILLPSVACLSLPYLFTIFLIKDTISVER
jgi:hypothetical protein